MPLPSYTPHRVVSLVPSITESLFELGLGDTVVGVTDYCIYPQDAVARLPKVGGPKNPNIDLILDLEPDLVIANREENTPLAVQALEMAGIPVWVTFPNTVDETLEMLREMAGMFRRREAARKVEFLARSVALERRVSRERRVRYFVPIWEGQTGRGLRWWMTFNDQTYTGDLLRLFGGENVFAERERLYPLEADLGLAPPRPAEGRDTRYPRVSLDEVLAAQPELILLPNEPCSYNEAKRREIAALLSDTPAAKNGRIYLVDGTLLFWFGTRLAKAIAELPRYFGFVGA